MRIQLYFYILRIKVWIAAVMPTIVPNMVIIHDPTLFQIGILNSLVATIPIRRFYNFRN